MTNQINAPVPIERRFISLDIHRSYAVIGGVNAQMQIVMKPKRVDNEHLEAWVQENLKSEDWAVIESTSNAWHVHDLLKKHVAEVKVANPLMVKLIAAAPVKTDGRDVMHLARLLAIGWLPEVWVPDKPVRELRALMAHRTNLIHQRTRLRNRLSSILQSHNIVPPSGDPFTKNNREWWDHLSLSTTERLRLKQDWMQISQLAPLIEACENEINLCSTTEPWREQAAYLMQFSGVGIVTAMTVLSAIGDIKRFASAGRLVGYAGLGTYVHDSGKTHHQGPIGKQGRAELRHVMVEAAWIAVDKSEYWRAQFERLCKRKPKGVAIVAIARRMLEAIWHALTKCQPDIHANEAQVAKKFWRWSSELRKPGRRGQSIVEFARTELDRVGLAEDVEQIPHGKGKPFILPPSKRALTTA